MNQTYYDIFISYKRKSLPTANNLYYRLTTRGYSTFFDLEEMRRDNFNVQLLNYIENAKDMFVILEEGSLDGCKEKDWEEKDWFCHEIAFALEKKKNIIPILLGGYKMPSENFFPNKLKELSLKHSPDFSFSFFDAYLDKLIEKKFITSEAHIQNKATSIFKFYSNENCQIFKEGKLVCSLEGMSDEPYYLPVSRKGDYRFKGVNTNTTETILIKEHIDSDEEKDIEIGWSSEVSYKTSQDTKKQILAKSANKAKGDSKLNQTELSSLFEQAYSYWRDGDYDKSFPIFCELANGGYEQAYGYVGLCYELGNGVAKDYQQMHIYYHKAIEAKIYLGVYRLGMFYASRGDYDKARQLYEQAIQEGWATGDAYIKIAAMYEKGLGGKIDLGKAIKYYRIALQHHEEEAQSALNRLGVYDEVVLPDSILNNSSEQLYNLGKQNCEGFGSNKALAFAYFKAAAAKGHPFAAKRVVQMHSEDGFPFEDEGVIREYKQLATNEMIIWTQRDSRFAWEAGYAYHYGVGCFTSREKAEECFRIGMEHGSASCRWEFGRIEEAKGNLSDAYNHYRLAAEGGQGMAMFELARCYETGIGTTKDLIKAIRWYEACSQSHYASATEAKNKLRKLKLMIE